MTTIHIDGASLGNPGKIGIGYVISRAGTQEKRASVFLGEQTNNFAEYMALIFALTDALRWKDEECRIFSDSQLLCEQIKGNYKVRNKNIYPLYVLAMHLLSQFTQPVSLTHVRREKNTIADRLAKEGAAHRG
ncbi:MAG: reverse transcriptase-like protein [Candidatus Omnitrophica bacterium]|nr:reverse transcriptase-like protein [Candidatus Omnitrophota bacterium]